MDKYATLAYSLPPLMCAHWDVWIWPFMILLLAAADLSFTASSMFSRHSLCHVHVFFAFSTLGINLKAKPFSLKLSRGQNGSTGLMW